MPRRFHHGLTDSTNERAFAALAAGEGRHGDVHVAYGQTAGRGRRGGAWLSPSGLGLYLSLVLRPAGAPPPAALTVAGGLAALDAVRGLGLADARLKWPNDVLVGGAKLAGVLVETRGFDRERPVYVLGVGLNVAQRSFPPELDRPATSLALEGVTVGVPVVERALLEHLAARLAQVERDLPRLARDFAAAAGLAGAVRASGAGGELVGELLDLTLDGGLRLRDAAGHTRRLALEHLRRVEPA